jgi:hypothetical protein
MFIDVKETKMPEAMQLDPLAQKDWFPEILLDVSEEKYFEGKRVS